MVETLPQNLAPLRGAGRAGSSVRLRTSRVAGTSVLTERLRALGGVGMHNPPPPRFLTYAVCTK
jgi:hypothetical protein